MRARDAATAAALLCAAALPLGVSGATSFQLTQMIGIAIALIGLNVFTGWAGQPSLAQGALFALGAYVTAMACRAGLPWGLSLAVAGMAVGALAGLLALPLLRLSHTYLALATFALALAVPQVLRHASLAPWTGGTRGLELNRPRPPAWLSELTGDKLGPDAWMYGIALVLALLITASLARLLSGNAGLALRAVRDNPIAASAQGVNVRLVKSLAFAFSGVCAAVGGGLYALNVQFIGPDSFGVFLSLTMLVALVVGGPGRTLGPWLGAAFLQFVPSWAERISTSAPWAIFGLSVLLVVFIAPGGAAGALQSVAQALRGLRSRAPAGPQAAAE